MAATYTKPPLTIGTDDYLKLASSEVFVDKSLLIKDFLEDMAEALLITRPRRGIVKTILLTLACLYERIEISSPPTSPSSYYIALNAY